ncbi:gtp binding protein [Moniliophthora roreri]|nr:gtp binding protein [Moniliophthora roreri]
MPLISPFFFLAVRISIIVITITTTWGIVMFTGVRLTAATKLSGRMHDLPFFWW